MDAESYSALVSSAANQPLGGKEMPFPFNGISRTIVGLRLGEPYAVAASNVILRAPYNGNRCGGTRPGLKAFSGTQPTTPVSHWMWPNGDKILWPNEDNMVFDNLGTKIVMPDGGVLFNPHETFAVSASKGSVPGSCSVFSWYRARMIVASGNMWYASRIGSYDDFDYGGDMEDPSRAVAGSVALAGREGETITAIASIADGVLIIATARSLWKVVGEVTGSLGVISEHTGIVSRDAWCWDGVRFWFMSAKGLCSMALGEYPVVVTPHLDGVMTGWQSATLVFDTERNGIHIIGTNNSGDAADFFYDIVNGAAWPVKYPTAKRPTMGGLAMLNYKNRVVFLCADSVWRYWDEDQITDDGTDIVSAVAIGPVTHTTGNTENGFLAEVDCEVATPVTSNDGLNFAGVIGRTASEALDRAETYVSWVVGGASGTAPNETFRYVQTPGWNRVKRPRVRCNSFAAIIWRTSGRWAISKITAVHRGCGRIRK